MIRALLAALILACPAATGQQATVRCEGGNCVLPESDLRLLLVSLREATQRVNQLEALCNWRPSVKPK